MYKWDCRSVVIFRSFHFQITSCCFHKFRASSANWILRVTSKFGSFTALLFPTHTVIRLEKWNQRESRERSLLMRDVCLNSDWSSVVCTCALLLRSVVGVLYLAQSCFAIKRLFAIAIDFVPISEYCYKKGKRLIQVYNKMAGPICLKRMHASIVYNIVIVRIVILRKQV